MDEETMAKVAGFCGTMNKSKAETRLQQEDHSCFLTRYSPASKTYKLSVMKKRKVKKPFFKHYKLIVMVNGSNQARYQVEAGKMEFKSISDLLQFYQSNAIDHEVENIGENINNKSSPHNLVCKAIQLLRNRATNDSYYAGCFTHSIIIKYNYW